MIKIRTKPLFLRSSVSLKTKVKANNILIMRLDKPDRFTTMKLDTLTSLDWATCKIVNLNENTARLEWVDKDTVYMVTTISATIAKKTTYAANVRDVKNHAHQEIIKLQLERAYDYITNIGVTYKLRYAGSTVHLIYCIGSCSLDMSYLNNFRRNGNQILRKGKRIIKTLNRQMETLFKMLLEHGYKGDVSTVDFKLYFTGITDLKMVLMKLAREVICERAKQELLDLGLEMDNGKLVKSKTESEMIDVSERVKVLASELRIKKRYSRFKIHKEELSPEEEEILRENLEKYLSEFKPL